MIFGLAYKYKIDKNNDTCTQFYTPYPGTPLYDKMIKEYGFKPPKSLIEWAEYDPSTSEMTWVDKEYKEKLQAYMEEEGIKDEENVDPFVFPSQTEYRIGKLREIKKENRNENI